MPLYANRRTLDEIGITFRHLFNEDRSSRVTQLDPIEITGNFRIGNLEFEPVEVMHGKLPILGFKIGPFGYVTDVSGIPEGSKEKLKGLKCLVLDGLRYQPHHTHYSIEEAVSVACELEAEQLYLVHMCHDVEHQEANKRLPSNMSLAYDGLELHF
jgi:phosphoribosyl 1,2-cyclic phosphate phosphodiesterase